ncbi:SpoIIE family protein phosphatase [Streptomyces humicola]|nr:SpoIIE family protein phosphatase [Streptomyces humicola]
MGLTAVTSGLLALLIGLAFAVLLWSIVNMRDSLAATQHSQATLTQSTKVEGLILDLETGQRGYVITRQAQFLEPWRTARSTFPGQARQLVQMSSTPGQKNLAQQISQAGNSLINDYSVPLVEMASRGNPYARSVAATQEGKRRVDALRKQFARYEMDEGSILASGRMAAEAKARRAVELASVGLAGSVVLIVAFASYVTRAIVWPIRRAAAFAARLAGGDLTARMPETGTGEIGELEAAFNTMGGSLEKSRERAQETHQRLKLLYDASVAVGTTLDGEEIAQQLVDVAVQQRFADFATVDLAVPVLQGKETPDDSTTEMRRVAVGGVRRDSPLHPVGTLITPSHPPGPWIGTAAIEPDLQTSTTWQHHSPEESRRLLDYGIHSLITVPLHARTTLLGTVNFWRSQSSRPFEEDELSDAEELAAKAAVSIENARLYQQVRNSSEQFQRLLLPRLPDLHPFTVAADYRPATTPGHLGGDWYDAFRLPDGACAVVVGDVVGHDLRAAASMSQTRNMLRALLYDLSTPPSAVLTQLDRTLDAITENPVTTACLARVEPAGEVWRLHWSNAGHPPPLLLAPGSEPEYLAADPGVPLCVDSEQPRPNHIHPLHPDTTVIFFTDGLVEHPRRSLDEGLKVLAATAAAHADQPLQRLLQILADRHPSDGHDDMAVLGLRTPTRPRLPGDATGASHRAPMRP